MTLDIFFPVSRDKRVHDLKNVNEQNAKNASDRIKCLWI